MIEVGPLQSSEISTLAERCSSRVRGPVHGDLLGFCTRLGESGADAFTIQKLAGHSSVEISQRYVHPTPARLEKAIDMLEASTISSTAPKGENASS